MMHKMLRAAIALRQRETEHSNNNNLCKLVLCRQECYIASNLPFRCVFDCYYLLHEYLAAILLPPNLYTNQYLIKLKKFIICIIPMCFGQIFVICHQLTGCGPEV